LHKYAGFVKFKMNIRDINSSWMIILNILLNKHLAQFAS
jgi:hypothetical protein